MGKWLISGLSQAGEVVIFWVWGWAVYACVAPLKTEQEWMISRPNQHLSSRDTQSFSKLSVWLATLNLLITSIYAKCLHILLSVSEWWAFVWVPADVDFSARFHRMAFFFSGEIVACQELFYLLALPVSSAQSAAHFLAGFSAVIAGVALSNLTEMAMRSWLQSLLLRFVNGDRRDFDFVGIPYRGSIGCKGRDLYTNWWYCSFRFATQVLNFPTNCSSCNAPAETRMKVVGILPASFSCWVLTVNIITYSRSCCLSHVTRVLFSFDFIFATPLLSGSLLQASLQAVRLYISMCIVLFLSIIKHVKSCAL